ncbi:MULTISPECIES: hypothetical protein [Pseudomonas]|jgi:hypothetical protein|uniref:hypothetical protein n=1 Tax=Pseudomonas TaxID=286 RepID=UPI00235F8CCA|nr:hypothetical protein [Pseudomonas sp. TNT2022 ID642]MDD1003615.1 hypothetical protein [Pseudomonas sp. TNT2022 ID642]
MTAAALFRDRAFLFVSMYLAALFISLILLGWLLFVGGNPITIKNYGLISATGYPVEGFRVGEIAGMKWQLCADKAVTIEQFPALRDARGLVFPLPITLSESATGCHDTFYGFVVPPLPPGEYTYVTNIRFQNNLVGRDEAATFPPVRVRITYERTH